MVVGTTIDDGEEVFAFEVKSFNASIIIDIVVVGYFPFSFRFHFRNDHDCKSMVNVH